MDGLSAPSVEEAVRADYEPGQLPLIAMILGIVGLVLFQPLGVASLVMGILALRRGLPAGSNERVFAIVAIVTGAFAIVGMILALILFMAVAGLA